MLWSNERLSSLAEGHCGVKGGWCPLSLMSDNGPGASWQVLGSKSWMSLHLEAGGFCKAEVGWCLLM